MLETVGRGFDLEEDFKISDRRMSCTGTRSFDLWNLTARSLACDALFKLKHPTVPGAPLSFATNATSPDQNPKNLHVEHRNLFGVITNSWL